MLSEKSWTQNNILYGSTYMKFLKGHILLPVMISSKDFIYPPARNEEQQEQKRWKWRRMSTKVWET